MVRKNISGIEIESVSPSVEGGLRIRVSNLSFGFLQGKQIEVKGTIPLEHSFCGDFVISLFDCTGGQLLPIQCLSPDFQEEETSAFQYAHEIDEVDSALEFLEWEPIGTIGPGLLNGPFQDSRNLMFVVRLLDMDYVHEIRYGKILSTEGVLWTGIKKFKYDLEDDGYLDAEIRRQRFHFLSIRLAMLIAAAGGPIGEQVIKVVQAKMGEWLHRAASPERIYDGFFYDRERLESYLGQFSQALQQARNGALSQSRLFTELRQSCPPSQAAELVEFCFDIMEAGGEITSHALELIDKIARARRVDPKKLEKIRDEKIVKIGAGVKFDTHAEQLLGINSYWKSKKKVEHLHSEFHKWNSRLNVVPEGETRENIQRLLDMIGDALKKYR